MASSLREPQSWNCRADDSHRVQVTILASEWGSSKGGLSTINRELAIQLAKCPEVEITFFLPQCSQEDKKVAMKHNVNIVEATALPGFEQLDWLCFPPEDLQIDIIVGHGVKLGKQAQIIKKSKRCKWVQVVHTDPEELGMFKNYSDPISKGEEKHKTEVKLCELADHVVGVGPKLSEAFRSYLRSCQKDDNVVDFTPGVFVEFASVKQAPSERQQRSVLVFGRGDVEDFKLKGFDIAGKAVAELEDTRLVFVGAPDGKHEEIAKRLTECGVPASHLRVRGFVQDRESLRRLFQEVDLLVMPSRTEGFGLTGLEALSAGLPVLVSHNSGFGKALHSVPFGSTCVVKSEEPADWTSAIKTILVKDRRSRLEEAETLRESYGKKYNWAKQIQDLIDMMINWVYDDSLDYQSSSEAKRRIFPSTDKASQQMEGTTVDPEAWNVFPSLQNLRCDAEQVSKKTNLPSDMRVIAANKGFFVSDNQASGNCLFHALSEQLQSVKGIQIPHKELRKTLVQFLDKNPNLREGTSLLNFVSGYPSWREYLQSMAKDGTWGDHVVLLAAANYFQTPIRIISSLDREIVVHPEHTVADPTPLVLGHIHEFHYVSLQPRQVCVKPFQPTVMQATKRKRDVAEDSDVEGSKILKSSEDTTSRSEGSDGNTPWLTAGLPSSSKNTANNTKNQKTTSKKKRKKKRKRERKERTPNTCIRDPSEHGSKIIRTSEDSTSRSEDSDGNTPQLTTDFLEDTTSRSDGSDGSAPQLTSHLPSCVNNTASNAKKPIRGPPKLNKVLPSLADINTITKPSKGADLPVDVLLLTVKNCEFLACYSELKNPYRCYFDGLGHVYFSSVGKSQEKVKVALLKCYENSAGPGGSLVSVMNAATVLKPKAVVSVGTCSSLHPEKCKLGDVVVSAKLATYASKVVINNQEHSTGMRNYVSKHFLNVIKNCADGWQAPLKNVADAQQVQVYTAAEFLTGPEQVISKQRRDRLAEANPQAIAMENEGEGVFTAAFDCGIEWLIVKGIADYADGSQLASESWSSCASVMAASLVVHILNESFVFHSWPHYQAGPQQQECKDGRTERRSSTASSSKSSHDSSFNCTQTNEGTLVAPFIERMKKHVRDVTEKPYGDRKSPFHNPGEGPRRDLKLDEIFTNLIVYEGRAKYDFSGDRVKQLKEYHKANENLPPILPGDIFDAKGRKILVVGRPGIGKTMFSTKILRSWGCDNLLNGSQKLQMDFKAAFLIKLRMFNCTNKELNLRELLDHSEYSTALSEDYWNYVRRNPERLLVIFDGFDEYSGRTEINKDDVPYRNNEEERMPVHFLLKKIVSGKILTGATVLTTTRPNAVRCSLDFDKTVEILGFSTAQVNDYVQKFTKEEDKAETIKQHIISNLNLVAFCYVPVNCFIICCCLLQLLGSTTGFTSLPTRLTEIYSIAVRMFYFSYDDDQYRHNKTEGQQFFLKSFKELPSPVQNVFTRLGKIAFDGIKEGRLIFESHEVKDQESNGLFHRLPDTRDRPLAEPRPQYCFMHLTIQEFLAAKYLVDTLSSEELRDFVFAHIQEGAWKVVMQFVAGLLAEKEGQSTDIFSDFLPSATFTKVVKIKLDEDSEERTEKLTRWPADEDQSLVMTLFNCMYENNSSDQKVKKKLKKIGCNSLDFSDCNLSPLDCLALVHALKSVEGILDFDLSFNNLQLLGCIEIGCNALDLGFCNLSPLDCLPGNEHNQSFCELKRLNLAFNQITD